jgi:hypothetical protein
MDYIRKRTQSRLLRMGDQRTRTAKVAEALVRNTSVSV